MFARNRAAAAAVAAPAAASGIPLSVAQRVAARRLQESKQTVPHFYLQTSVNASRMMARREAAKPLKLAWDAFFVLAAAKAIAKFERFRCRLDGDRLTPIESDAVGVAVDEGNELFVLPVAAPTTKSVEQISAEIRQNVERLRGGDPQSRRIHPALLTIRTSASATSRRLSRLSIHRKQRSWAWAGSCRRPWSRAMARSASSRAARSR